jgi:glycyl-tRNA synthetase beta subunit
MGGEEGRARFSHHEGRALPPKVVFNEVHTHQIHFPTLNSETQVLNQFRMLHGNVYRGKML